MEEASSSSSEQPPFQSLFASHNIMDEFNLLRDILQNIEWTEPWVLLLCLSHLLITSLTILTRKRPTIQAIIFISITIPIFLAERLNVLAAENWRYFSRHQYFDSQGTFISLMLSAPLLFNCLIMVMNWLKISSELMTSLRRFQLLAEARKMKRLASKSSANAETSPSSSSSGSKVSKAKTDSSKSKQRKSVKVE